MFHSDFEVFPRGPRIDAREICAGFVVEPYLFMRDKSVSDGRHQNHVIIRFRYATLADEGDDVAGKIGKLNDHRIALASFFESVFQVGRSVPQQ